MLRDDDLPEIQRANDDGFLTNYAPTLLISEPRWPTLIRSHL